jgi:hypothetical protein
MNRIRRFSMAVFMAVVVTTSTFAGTIHTGAVPPPPPPPEETLTVDADDTGTADATDPGSVQSDLGTELILNLLQLLTVF